LTSTGAQGATLTRTPHSLGYTWAELDKLSQGRSRRHSQERRPTPRTSGMCGCGSTLPADVGRRCEGCIWVQTEKEKKWIEMDVQQFSKHFNTGPRVPGICLVCAGRRQFPSAPESEFAAGPADLRKPKFEFAGHRSEPGRVERNSTVPPSISLTAVALLPNMNTVNTSYIPYSVLRVFLVYRIHNLTTEYENICTPG
jgi:hypothetical protein